MRKSVMVYAVLLTAVVLSGCAGTVNKEWISTGGSRADATVELSYEFNPLREIPMLNEQQGLDLATLRCRSWGYQRAEPFGGTKKICNNMLYGLFESSCTSNLVTKQYQCLGQVSDMPYGNY